MSPARSAVLRDVLIKLMGQTAFAVDVVPVPFYGEIVFVEVAVKCGRIE